MFKELSVKIASNYLHDLLAITFEKTAFLKPLFFTFYATLRCNFSCSYCTFAAGGQTGSSHDELDTAGVIHLLTIMRKESTAIYFTGGEPLVRKDIVEILEVSAAMGFTSISLNTNMSVIHRKMEVLDYVTNLVASYDMTNEEEYAGVLGVSRNMVRQVVRNIVECAGLQKEKSFRMTVNCVLTPQTIPGAREVMEFCFEHGIRFAVVPAELEDGRINETLKNSGEYRLLLQDIIAAKKMNKPVFGSFPFLNTIRSYEPFDCFPTLTPHVYPNGDLFYPCEPAQKIAANLLEVGDYRKALRMGMEKHGPLPRCRNRCHKACYVEPSVLMKKPGTLLKEMIIP